MNDDDAPNDDVPKMPLPNQKDDSSAEASPADPDLAAELIRKKLKNIYEDEPAAKKELTEIKAEGHPPSKHQKFLIKLQESGKSIPEIQVEWHKYYLSLPDEEKNQVWKEFYDSSKQLNKTHVFIHPVQEIDKKYSKSDRKLGEKVNSKINEKRKALAAKIEPEEDSGKEADTKKKTKTSAKDKEESEVRAEEGKTAAEVKKEVINRVQSRAKTTWLQRFHSLAFGLAVGFFVILIFLFSFFNDRFIAPFITPSRDVSAQSLITTANGGPVSPNPLVIIPKINVEIPVIYNLPTNTTEDQIENNLENGVVHYPTTAYPGQDGNGAIFGHSSNNILNPGKYKFAFVLLHDLTIGDTFTLDYNGTAYVYQIFQRQIVSPGDVSVLNNIPGHTATFTLITCDPPGTSINRLVVVGDQISPAIASNSAGPDQNAAAKPSILPSNSPSLWSRLTHWL